MFSRRNVLCIYVVFAYLQSLQGDKIVEAAALDRMKLVLDQMPTTPS